MPRIKKKKKISYLLFSFGSLFESQRVWTVSVTVIYSCITHSIWKGPSQHTYIKRNMTQNCLFYEICAVGLNWKYRGCLSSYFWTYVSLQWEIFTTFFSKSNREKICEATLQTGSLAVYLIQEWDTGMFTHPASKMICRSLEVFFLSFL